MSWGCQVWDRGEVGIGEAGAGESKRLLQMGPLLLRVGVGVGGRLEFLVNWLRAPLG